MGKFEFKILKDITKEREQRNEDKNNETLFCDCCEGLHKTLEDRVAQAETIRDYDRENPDEDSR